MALTRLKNGVRVMVSAQEEADILAEWSTNQAEQAADQAIIDQKIQDFIDSLPSWSAVSTSIDNIGSMADAQVILKKMARVIYWLAKNQPN